MKRAIAAMIAITLLTGGPARGEEIADAKIHYQAGASYFDKKDYLSALREFNEAYRLSHRGLLLFNIGLCEEKLDMYADAIASLRAYLAVPESEKDHALVEEKLKRLEELQRKKAAGEPVPAEPVPVEPAPAKRPIVPLAVIGGGAVLLIGALATGVAAHSQYAALQQKCGADGMSCPADFAAQRDLGRALGYTTDVLLVAGVVAAAVGVVLFVVTREQAPVKAAILPVIGPREAGVVGEVRF